MKNPVRFLVSPIPEDHGFSETDFICPVTGRHFYFEVATVGEDEDIVIRDTCGRFMPIAYDQVHDLSRIFEALAAMKEAEDIADEELTKTFVEIATSLGGSVYPL